MSSEPDEVHLSTANRRLLAKLLRATHSVFSGVDAAKFRAQNGAAMERLDWLESAGFIRKDAGRYCLSLLALEQLSAPKARLLLHDARRLFQELREHYVLHQTTPIALSTLSTATGIPLPRVRESMGYLLEHPWWAGRSTDLTDSGLNEATVIPSERVVSLRSLRGLLAQLRGWQVARVQSRHQLHEAMTSDSLAVSAPSVPASAEKLARARSTGGTTPVYRTPPDWLPKLPRAIEAMLREVYLAHESGAMWLTAIGLRAVVETLSIALIGDARTYGEKLDLLRERGLVSAADRQMLETVIDVGSAAAHRSYAPKRQHVQVMFDIVERLLLGHFVLPIAAAEVRRTTPQRIRLRKT